MQSQMKACIKIWILLFYHLPRQRQTLPFSTLQFQSEPQNGWSWKWALEVTGSTFWLKQGTRAHYPGLCPRSFWISPGEETPQFIWVIYSNALSPSKKWRFYLNSDENSCSKLCSLPLVLYHLGTTEKSLILSWHLPSDTYTHFRDPPCPLSSRLNRSSSPHVRCPSSILVALPWTRSRNLKSLLYWKAQDWTLLQVMPH